MITPRTPAQELNSKELIDRYILLLRAILRTALARAEERPEWTTEALALALGLRDSWALAYSLGVSENFLAAVQMGYAGKEAGAYMGTAAYAAGHSLRIEFSPWTEKAVTFVVEQKEKEKQELCNEYIKRYRALQEYTSKVINRYCEK